MLQCTWSCLGFQKRTPFSYEMYGDPCFSGWFGMGSGGDVRVNWKEVTKNGLCLKTGDVVSVSGKGRIEVWQHLLPIYLLSFYPSANSITKWFILAKECYQLVSLFGTLHQWACRTSIMCRISLQITEGSDSIYRYLNIIYTSRKSELLGVEIFRWEKSPWQRRVDMQWSSQGFYDLEVNFNPTSFNGNSWQSNVVQH